MKPIIQLHLRVKQRLSGAIPPSTCIIHFSMFNKTDPNDLAVEGEGLLPLDCWDCGFESHCRHESFSLVFVVCCQVEVSATGRSLVEGSPTDCGFIVRDVVQ